MEMRNEKEEEEEGDLLTIKLVIAFIIISSDDLVF